MSRINRLLRITTLVIGVCICLQQTGCIGLMTNGKYTKEEMLAMGSEYEAAGPLSPLPKIEGERVREPSLLYGKWRAEVQREMIRLCEFWMDDEDQIKNEGKNIYEYDFKKDGTFVLITTSCTKIGAVIAKLETNGKWHLQNGELTLVSAHKNVYRPKYNPYLPREHYQNMNQNTITDITTKELVTVCPEGIMMWEIDFSHEDEAQAKSNEIALAQYPAIHREQLRKQLGRNRQEYGYDRRGYCVKRMWSVDDKNRVFGVMTIVSTGPALYKRVENAAE